MTSASSRRPGLTTDETGKKYGSFTVLSYAGAKRGKACWSVTCDLCGHQAISKGVDLRKGIYPRHKCIRICRECGRSESETKFDKNRQVGNICLDCKKELVKSWREENTEHRTEYKKRWNVDSPEKITEYRYNERKKVQESPYKFLSYIFKMKVRTNQYRKSKDGKELPPRIVEVTTEEVVALWDKQNGRCAISGMPMAHEFKNLRSVSIDRIDNNKGYVPGNVQLVCQWVNYAKNRYSNAEIGEVLAEFKVII